MSKLLWTRRINRICRDGTAFEAEEWDSLGIDGRRQLRLHLLGIKVQVRRFRVSSWPRRESISNRIQGPRKYMSAWVDRHEGDSESGVNDGLELDRNVQRKEGKDIQASQH